MPRYRCHKEVWAVKIKAIAPVVVEGDTEAAWIYPAEEGYGSFLVDPAYLAKHKPEVGGYYVVYKDGYKSFSPAEAFEDGYTLIDQRHGAKQ